jgi:hypothetical protein
MDKYPLMWPEGWIRCRIDKRGERTAWKKPLNHYAESLRMELRAMMRIAPKTIYNIIGSLKSDGFLEKNGGLFKLKQ